MSKMLLDLDLHSLSPLKILGSLLLLAFTAVVIDYFRVLLLRSKMPPGPLPMPIIGNVLQLPKSKPWYRFEEWANKYDSPIITVWFGRNPTVVLNDCWTASDLMDKRANIYSSRPTFQVPGVVMDGEKYNQTMLPYGDRWRLHRKLTHFSVGAQAVRGHQGFQADESRVLTKDILDNPEDFSMAIERYSCSVVSIIGWGRRISRKDDPIVERALEFMHTAAQIFVPGDYWMETIPLLSYLPSWLYALPTQLRMGKDAMTNYWYALSREGAEKSTENCFSKHVFKLEAEGLRPEEIAGLTGNLIGGGVDTTTSTMLSFILAAVAFPEAIKPAQEEIEKFVGSDRSPDWSDENNLVYCKALIREVLRWRSVAILGGLPHAPTRDDMYRGFLIPKDTSIMGNIWAIHRHPREFPEPDVFKPERYLAENRTPYPNERGYNTFGFGRRQCSGQPLAEQGLYTSICRLLWAFDIKPALDDNGKEIPADIFAYTDGENMRPQPFRARFIPRNARVLNALEREAAEAKERLKKWDGETKVNIKDFFPAK